MQFVPLDVTDQQSVDRAAADIDRQYGRLDILVNNAGIALDWFPPSELETEVLRKTFDTNVFGTFRVTKAMLPLLKKSKAGRIVNMSSALASMTFAAASEGPFRGTNRLLAYGSSKSALNAMTLAFARDLKRYGNQSKRGESGLRSNRYERKQRRQNRGARRGDAVPFSSAP